MFKLFIKLLTCILCYQKLHYTNETSLSCSLYHHSVFIVANIELKSPVVHRLRLKMIAAWDVTQFSVIVRRYFIRTCCLCCHCSLFPQTELARCIVRIDHAPWWRRQQIPVCNFGRTFCLPGSKVSQKKSVVLYCIYLHSINLYNKMWK